MNKQSSARITGEATLTKLSDQLRAHPSYPSLLGVSAEFEIALSAEDAALAQELLNKNTGTIVWHVRSALAQLGIEAFGDDYTRTTLVGTTLKAETTVSDLRVQHGSPTITALMSLLRTQTKDDPPLRVAHAGLFPHAAKITDAGPIEFPIEAGYRLDAHHQPSEIQTMLCGSAREWIKDHRKPLTSVPQKILPKTFFLGGIDVRRYNSHVVLLDADVRLNGKPSKVRQNRSTILEKGRSNGKREKNSDHFRQVEIYNYEGIPVKTGDLLVTGALFHSEQTASGA